MLSTASLRARQAAACALEFQELATSRSAASANESLLHWRPDYTYRYNITIGGVEYGGPLPNLDPDTAFVGPPVLFTVPNARITYIANVTAVTARNMLLGNLDKHGNTIISSELVELRVLWCPDEGELILTSNLYVGCTIEVYSNVVALLRPRHVVRITSSLSPVGAVASVSARGGLLPTGDLAKATTITLGDASHCFRPIYLNLTHCAPPAGPLSEYALQGRRESEAGSPWRTLAHVLEPPARIPALSALGIPVNVSIADSTPVAPMAAAGDPSRCDYSSLTVVGLPFRSSFSLLWTDMAGDTHRYQRGQCLMNVREVVLIYGAPIAESERTGLAQPPPPAPFLIEGRGGRLETAVVVTVRTTPSSAVVRLAVDAASPSQLAELSAATASLRPVPGETITSQTIYAGLEAEPFRLEVPTDAFANVAAPELHGFVYSARQLITTGEPTALPVWLRFDGLSLSAEPFYWKNVPYIDEVTRPYIPPRPQF